MTHYFSYDGRGFLPFPQQRSFVFDISFNVVENMMALLTDWSQALDFLFVNILCPIKRDNIEQNFLCQDRRNLQLPTECICWFCYWCEVSELTLPKLLQCTRSSNLTFSPTLHLKWSSHIKQATHFDCILQRLQRESKSYNSCKNTACWEMENNLMQLMFLLRLSFTKENSLETNRFKVMPFFIYPFLLIKKLLVCQRSYCSEVFLSNLEFCFHFWWFYWNKKITPSSSVLLWHILTR